GVEQLLDLARVDVLTAADHHVLDPAGDVHVTLVIHHPEVAGVHPARGVDGFGGLVRLVPVAEHHRVAAGAPRPRVPAVAGVHPARGVDGCGGLVRLVPVAEHHRVAAGAQLTGFPAGHGQPGLGV